jgi:hypothetical protein
VQSSSTESRSSDRKLKPLPPDHFRHQNSAIALQLIEVTQKLTPGISGGPLLDANDAVAGIIHKGGPAEGRDFAVHIKMLEDWLKEG